MSDSGILDIIKRKDPGKEFEILKQIGSGTYGEVYKVRGGSGGREIGYGVYRKEGGVKGSP